MNSFEWLRRRIQDLRYGRRSFAANPGFATVAVVTLALGIGATTAIFSVVNAVLLGPLPYHDVDRVVAVWGTDVKEHDLTPVSGGDFHEWQTASHVFSTLAASDEAAFTLTGEGHPRFVIGYQFSRDVFGLLGTRPQLGRTFTPDEDRPGGPFVVVLGDRIWRQVFHADPHIVGKPITLDSHPFTVVGVMPAGFRYPQSVELWVPLRLAPARLQDYSETSLRLLGRLKPGISLARAQTELNAIEHGIGRRHPQTDSQLAVNLTPLREQLAGDVKTPLLVLAGAVAGVLLIACTNVANLFLVRGAGRRSEIAVRAALGASRGRLLGQFLTEGTLLAIVGGVLGLGFAFAARGPLLALFPRNIANLSVPEVSAIPIDARVLGVSLAVTLLAGLLFGATPALQHAQPRLEALAEGGRGRTSSGRVRRVRDGMAVVEIALALVLLVGTGLLVASFRNLARSDFGFRTDHIATAQMFLARDKYPSSAPAGQVEFIDRVLAATRTLPGVESAAAVNFVPLSGFWGRTTFVVEGQPKPQPGQEPSANPGIVTPGYFKTMGIPLVAGRVFDDHDRQGAPDVAIVSRELTRKVWGSQSPLGQKINTGSATVPHWLTVIGVVGDVRALGLTEPIHPSLYRPYAQRPYGVVAIVARTTGDPGRVVGDLQRTIWSIDPDQPIFKSITLDQLAAESLAIRRVSMLLLTSFSFLALVLAAVGVYGVIAFSVAQRTHEIGIRVALGARPSQVLRGVLGEGMRLVLWGVGLGVGGALALTRLLGGLLVGVAPDDALTLAMVSLFVAFIALVASYVPSRRAAGVDPMVALRGDAKSV